MKSRIGLRWFAMTCALGLVGVAQAQNWTTVGNDAQRSGWLRSDAKISAESVAGGEFQPLWAMDLENEPHGLNGITAPSLLDFLISHKGFRSLAFVAGSDDNVFVIDKDLARMEWERRLAASAVEAQPSAGCPGGMTANIARPTSAALPSPLGLVSFGAGRRSPGVSGVGEPGQGAITLAARPAAPFRRPEPPEPGARERPPERPALFGLSVGHALTSDGMLHTMLATNGFDHQPPMRFLPPNAHAQGLVVIDGVAYVTTVNGCGGVDNGVWALDVGSGDVRSWKAGSGSVAGNAGPVFGPDKTIYVATDDGKLVSLDGTSLARKARFAGQTGFISSPVFLDVDGDDYLAVGTKDGAIHLFAAKRLSDGPVASTTGYDGAEGSVPAALATWTDADGTPWVVAAVGANPGGGLRTNGSVHEGAIAAWKIRTGAAVSFDGGWLSRNVAHPLTPIIVNGVVFAASGGDLGTGSPAVVYALDGGTGTALWDSGDTIKSPAPNGSLSAGGATVYLAAHDGTLYAYGFPIEH